MGWKRGEIWLETDLFAMEPAGAGAVPLEVGAPSFLGLTHAALTAAIPNGLAESRRRRAELRRRREARKTRAAALVIGPAVMLTLASPRPVGASRAGSALEQDPPSETLRAGPGAPDTTETVLPRRSGRTAAPAKAEAKPGSAPSFPAISWQRGTSHGLPYAGSLSGGTQLPVEGPDWVTWNPVADRVPNRPHRLYGNDRVIRKLIDVIERYRAANPDAPRAVVGDISFRGGGPMELHRSHQNGLDVDVYYPRLDRSLRAPTAPGQVDKALAQDLVDRFVAAGARMVFVGYSTGLRGPSEVVIPYPSHEDHMHVRFRPPRD